jgi:oxygen-independent coproporphyrinogen-3 oxidase
MTVKLSHGINDGAGIYIHIPFCISKCIYCDFNSGVATTDVIDRYVRVLIKETRHRAEQFDMPCAETVYFGGGTPSLLKSTHVTLLMNEIRTRFSISGNCEVTLEANPGTLSESRTHDFMAAGVNRISLGVQSLDDKMLRRLGRVHTAEDARESMKLLKRAGIGNTGIDLIFALPDQTVEHWGDTLTHGIALGADHVSIYNLTIEEGTPLKRELEEGKLALPSEDEEAQMYEMAIDMLTDNGYKHYEVSNFARQGKCSVHNQIYWHNGEYIGIGAGAFSYVDGVRASNIRGVKEYMNAIESGDFKWPFSEKLSREDSALETVAVGLRLLDGVNIERVKSRFGSRYVDIVMDRLSDFIDQGFLQVSENTLCVTRSGLLHLDDISCALV